jgi:hypothetical protein
MKGLRPRQRKLPDQIRSIQCATIGLAPVLMLYWRSAKRLRGAGVHGCAPRSRPSEVGREIGVDLATAGDLNELGGLPLHQSYLRSIYGCRQCRHGASVALIW